MLVLLLRYSATTTAWDACYYVLLFCDYCNIATTAEILTIFHCYSRSVLSVTAFCCQAGNVISSTHKPYAIDLLHGVHADSYTLNRNKN